MYIERVRDRGDIRVHLRIDRGDVEGTLGRVHHGRPHPHEKDRHEQNISVRNARIVPFRERESRNWYGEVSTFSKSASQRT